MLYFCSKDEDEDCRVIGILPKKMKAFKGWEIAKGDYFSSVEEKAIVIGSGIAQQFKLKPMDELTIKGEKIPVMGVFKATGGKDDIALFVPLSVAQRLYSVGDRVS